MDRTKIKNKDKDQKLRTKKNYKILSVWLQFTKKKDSRTVFDSDFNSVRVPSLNSKNLTIVRLFGTEY